MPTADLASERTMLVCLVGLLQMTSVGRCRELDAEHTKLSIATTCSTDDVARFRERHGLERDCEWRPGRAGDPRQRLDCTREWLHLAPTGVVGRVDLQ